MPSIWKEQMITLAEAADRLGVHKCTVVRWHLKGINGIRLETVRVGTHRRTSVEALARFQAKVDAAAEDAEPTEKKRARRKESAEAECARARI